MPRQIVPAYWLKTPPGYESQPFPKRQILEMARDLRHGGHQLLAVYIPQRPWHRRLFNIQDNSAIMAIKFNICRQVACQASDLEALKFSLAEKLANDHSLKSKGPGQAALFQAVAEAGLIKEEPGVVIWRQATSGDANGVGAVNMAQVLDKQLIYTLYAKQKATDEELRIGEELLKTWLAELRDPDENQTELETSLASPPGPAWFALLLTDYEAVPSWPSLEAAASGYTILQVYRHRARVAETAPSGSSEPGAGLDEVLALAVPAGYENRVTTAADFNALKTGLKNFQASTPANTFKILSERDDFVATFTRGQPTEGLNEIGPVVFAAYILRHKRVWTFLYYQQAPSYERLEAAREITLNCPQYLMIGGEEQ